MDFTTKLCFFGQTACEKRTKEIKTGLTDNNYARRVAEVLGIKLLDKVTEEERERVRQILSKGESLSKIVIENRGGN